MRIDLTQADPTARWTEEWLSRLIHRASAASPVEEMRRRLFVVSRLATSLAFLGTLPAFLLGQAPPGFLAHWAALSLAPLAAVFVLSRWGRHDAAQALVSAALTLLVAHAAAAGGLSPLVIGLALLSVPLDAMLVSTRRGFAVSCLLAVLGLPLCLMLQNMGLAGRSLSSGAILAAAGAVALGHAAARLMMDRALEALLASAAEAGEEREGETLLAMDDLVTWHDADGAILRSNAASARLPGLPASVIQGDGLFTRIHVADRPLFLKAFSDAVNGRGSALARFRVQSGEAGSCAQAMTWLEMRVHALALKGDERCAAVAVMRDISEHARVAEELELMQRDAARARQAHAERLALVGHELRAPLNAIVGSSEILMGAGGAGLAGRQERYGEIIHHSARRMQETVNAALDLSSIESGRYDLSFETIDMADLVRECCRAMAAAAQRSGIALIESIAPGLPPVTADRRACRQILLNLLSTAMKSTPPDGYVAVDLGHDGADVILNVNAAGMADRRRFEAPFHRESMLCAAKDEDGLLLSVARGLVGLHGGRIRMAKAPGGRSSVRISLPVDRRAASVLAPETARLNHDVLALKTG